MEQKYENTIKEALNIRRAAYIPYSNFAVGAALLCKNGKVYTGCNIENSAFTPTICAERVAFFDAIKNGERDFEAIAIVSGQKEDKKLDFASPCGVCRQVMTEFCDDDFMIILPKIDENNNIEECRMMNLNEILPFRFRKFK